MVVLVCFYLEKVFFSFIICFFLVLIQSSFCNFRLDVSLRLDNICLLQYKRIIPSKIPQWCHIASSSCISFPCMQVRFFNIKGNCPFNILCCSATSFTCIYILNDNMILSIKECIFTSSCDEQMIENDTALAVSIHAILLCGKTIKTSAQKKSFQVKQSLNLTY